MLGICDKIAAISFELQIFSLNNRMHDYQQGHAVAQLVEALRYKPEGRFPMVSLEFSIRSHYGPGVDSACNRNEYQENFLGGKGDR